MRKLVPARVSCPILLARFHVRLNRIKYQTRNRAKNRTKKSFNVGNRLQISIMQGDGTPESHKKLLPAVADPGRGPGGRPPYY